MNLPTVLTLVRVALIPFFLAAFLYKAPNEPLAGDWGKVIAAVCFIVAAITDYYDGYLARKYKKITTFGKFIDPVADKLLVCSALTAMIEYKSITFVSSWFVILIMAREFAVTGLRLVCAERGKVVDASAAGKLKTTSQLVAVITILCFISLRIAFETYGLQKELALFMTIYKPIIIILLILAAISTIYSAYEYFKNNKQFF